MAKTRFGDTSRWLIAKRGGRWYVCTPMWLNGKPYPKPCIAGRFSTGAEALAAFAAGGAA